MARRRLITAAYPPEQELGRESDLIRLATSSSNIELTPKLQLDACPPPIGSSNLVLQIINVTTQQGRITTRFHLYNGGTSSISITSDDIWLTLAYVENPSGPRMPAESLVPFELLPDQAAAVELVWNWRLEFRSSTWK